MESFAKLHWLVLWTDKALTEFDGFEIFNANAREETKILSLNFAKPILVLSASAERPKIYVVQIQITYQRAQDCNAIGVSFFKKLQDA